MLKSTTSAPPKASDVLMIHCSSDTAATVHMCCLPSAVPFSAQLVTSSPENSGKKTSPIPPPIHLRKALFMAISKRYNIPPSTTTRHAAAGNKPTLTNTWLLGSMTHLPTFLDENMYYNCKNIP